MALTSADVAKRACVSRSTVSYILNGQAHRFSEATQEAVRQAVEELGYMPQAAARSLVRGKSDLVVAVWPIAPNGLFYTQMAELTDALADRGLSLLFRTSGSSLASFTSTVRSLRPRALIALADLTDAERDVLDSAGVRAIELARAASEPGGWQWQAGQLQVAHLLDRGYERIAYARLAEARDDIMLRARQEGARAACRAAGLPEPQIITVTLRADADLEAVTSLPAHTGVACYNDDTAAAALGAANALGRAVPGDLGFIGMDDTPVATQTVPQLTTVGYGEAKFADDLAETVASGRALENLDSTASLSLEIVQRGTT